jgi:hypothetical protein
MYPHPAQQLKKSSINLKNKRHGSRRETIYLGRGRGQVRRGREK